MSAKHGFTIGIDRHEDEFFVTLKAKGKLTHEDYEVMTPVIDSAIAEVKHPSVNVMVDITELEGFQVRAAWDDLRFGLKHNNEFKRIAIVGNANWQELMAKVGSWFVSGEVEYFESHEEALNWIYKY